MACSDDDYDLHALAREKHASDARVAALRAEHASLCARQRVLDELIGVEASYKSALDARLNRPLLTRLPVAAFDALTDTLSDAQVCTLTCVARAFARLLDHAFWQRRAHLFCAAGARAVREAGARAKSAYLQGVAIAPDGASLGRHFVSTNARVFCMYRGDGTSAACTVYSVDDGARSIDAAPPANVAGACVMRAAVSHSGAYLAVAYTAAGQHDARHVCVFQYDAARRAYAFARSFSASASIITLLVDECGRAYVDCVSIAVIAPPAEAERVTLLWRVVAPLLPHVDVSRYTCRVSPRGTYLAIEERHEIVIVRMESGSVGVESDAVAETNLIRALTFADDERSFEVVTSQGAARLVRLESPPSSSSTSSPMAWRAEPSAEAPFCDADGNYLVAVQRNRQYYAYSAPPTLRIRFLARRH